MNIQISNKDYFERSKSYKGYHYSVLTPDMLDYIHKRTVEMVKEVVPILEKNNIKYMLCGGTLLGAYTRGRFFDWDEDFDMCVFEEDYERMIDCLTAELGRGKNIFVQCEKYESGYYLDWVKIRDTKSHVYPDIPTIDHNGVWIDIYKLVRTKANEADYIIAKGQYDYHKRRLAKGGFSQAEYEKRLAEYHLEEKVEEAKKRMETSDNHDDYYIVWSASKVLIRKEWVLPLKKYKIEGVEVTSFNQAEKYLIDHYGPSYMILPPDEKRRIGINKVEYKK